MEIYDEFANALMIEVLRNLLLYLHDHNSVDSNGALYVSFVTDSSMVSISQSTKKLYPKEMTIVLEHQYDHLKVNADSFTVGLSFKGAYERITIGFGAITSFAIPKLGLSCALDINLYKHPSKINIKTSFIDSDSVENNLDNVISLDDFRNKHKD